MSWALDSIREELDIQEDGDGNVQTRTHVTIVISQKHLGGNLTSSEVGTKQSTLSWSVGPTFNLKIGPASKKYLCTSDGLVADPKPGIYCTRQQTWEYYSPWADEDFT